MGTYYKNKITSYNEKYNDALSKISNINSKLSDLKTAFNTANGDDIEAIKADLNGIIKKVDDVQFDIEFAQERTNRHAEKADRVLDVCTQDRSSGMEANSDNMLNANGSCDLNGYPPTSYEGDYILKGVPPTTIFIDHNDELIHSKEQYYKIRESDDVIVAKITKEYYIEAYNLIAGYQTWTYLNSSTINAPNGGGGSHEFGSPSGGGGASHSFGDADYGGGGAGHEF